MKKNISLPIVLLLALVASNADAFLRHFHDCAPNWFVEPFVGVAPSLFTSRAHQDVVVPFSTIQQGIQPEVNVNNFVNGLQETSLLPKFGDMFNQGVLHVGIRAGRSICERSECFLEFVYNRSSGKCFGYCDTFVTVEATKGCSSCGDCSSSCDTNDSSNSCDSDCPAAGTATLSDISALQDNYSNYQAYGAYIGGRHYTNRFWCDAMAFWYGYKVGMLHRNTINSCSTITYNTSTVAVCGDTDSVTSNLNRAVFCRDNTVSGGLQIGFDYSYNDCLSFQLGFEVVASCGLRGNRNYAIDISAVQCGVTVLQNDLRLPTNIITTNTGTLLNFPVWIGLVWEFGSSCESRSNCCN